MALQIAASSARAHPTTVSQPLQTSQMWQVAATVALVAGAAIGITCLLASLGKITLMGVLGSFAAITIITGAWIVLSSNGTFLIDGLQRQRVLVVDTAALLPRPTPSWRWSLPLHAPPSPAVFHLTPPIPSHFGAAARGRSLFRPDASFAMRDGLHLAVGGARFARR